MAQDQTAQHEALLLDGEHLRASGTASRAELAFGASIALDLAEGKDPGHGQRVAYIGVSLARTMRSTAAECVGIYYAGLLHHAGIPFVATGLAVANGIDEADRHSATHAGFLASASADLGRKLALPGTATAGLASFAEYWDGTGGPAGTADEEIPTVGRLLAVADFAESAIANHPNPLKARAAVPQACSHAAGSRLDPAVVTALGALMRQDQFWLGLYDVQSATLGADAGVLSSERSGATRSSAANFGRSLATLIDAKTGYGPGHSVRVAGYAKAFALALGLPPETAETLWFAALWHDIGVMGVAHSIIAKPDLLSIEEMEAVRAHPEYSRQVFEATPGFEQAAQWVGSHHERVDGKGYPDGLSGDEVPVQAQMLAIIDTFDALTSDRPYRRAMSREEAVKVLWTQAGTQFEGGLVGVFEALVQ